MIQQLDGISPLPHLGVIRARGEEAAAFLHGQLTHDFTSLGRDHARLAAFCTAKGRMLASFIGLRRADGDILLVCSRDLLPAALKRLSMFVLRSKVKLTDATDDFILRGLAGPAVERVCGVQSTPWSMRECEGGDVITLYPADEQPRALWVAPAGTAEPDGPAMSLDLWHWGEVRSAVATITTPIVEAFVPQMLNYESVGGVNFKKGCYPGQEVVARSQFRGTLKRRGYLVHSDAAMQAGQEVFHESDATQPVGLVAQAAAVPDGGCDAIVSMQVSAANGGRLTVGNADGLALHVQQLPYLLLEDI